MQQENQNIVYLLKILILVLVIAGAMMVIFATGVWVGELRAQFSFQWAENYHYNFGGPKKGVLGNLPSADFTNSHGVYGTILMLSNEGLMIVDDDNKEKTVVIGSTATLVNNKGAIEFNDIRIGDRAVIIGQPNAQGQIEAKFIRILPAEMPVSFAEFING